MHRDGPLISVVTPVYNGEPYLAECIESVLEQTYTHWDYTIVNNCSSDQSLAIAQRYEAQDNRIRVVSNPQFVGMIANHNIAVRHISERSEYCKIVSADDWLYPECLAKLVDMAERNPTAGVVGSYAMMDRAVRSIGLPYNATLVPGRQACRAFLLGSIDAFGTPSTVLYRSSLVRSSDPFFPGTAPNADMAACLLYLQSADFAFVHQVLSFERRHEDAASTPLRGLNSFLADRVEFLLTYGSVYLTTDERAQRLEEVLRAYYRLLAWSLFDRRDRRFWTFHKERLAGLGYPLYGSRFVAAVASGGFDILFHPKRTIERRLRARRYGSFPQ